MLNKESKMSDPWANRSKGMLCSTCIWFVPKRKTGPDSETDIPVAQNVGRCRRHAPTITGYPVVYFNDWCGDHKLNENAV